jgi:hypothetical protein
MDEVEEFSFLWTDQASDHVLLTVRPGAGPENTLIYRVSSGTVMLIEDDHVAREVKRRMFDAGVPVVDDPPGRAV